jgi:RNA polymerase sigma-70 factor (ECF subfamily)
MFRRVRRRLDFHATFYLDRGVPDNDEVTSQSAIGGSAQNGAVAFATTHWSVVLTAQGESPAAQEALEGLCRTYWRPIYSFVRREGIRPEEAKDLTQGFFALILERKDFQSVRQEKGRLRSFLLASLKHFMANERRDAATIKRGGGRPLIPLDGIESYDCSEFDRSDMLSADLLYDRRWAFTVLDQVFSRLREESQGSASTSLLERLNTLLSDEPDRPSQAEIAREFGMTENAVKQAFHRLRQRYRQLLREEVAHTVATPAEIEDELRHLIAALRS